MVRRLRRRRSTHLFRFGASAPSGNNPDPTACLQPATGVDLGPAATGTGADTIVLTPSSFPPALPGPDPNASNYTLLLAMCPVSPPVFDTGSGQYQCPSEVSIPYAQREGIQAETTIVVRSSPPLNQNPGIAAVGINFEPANLESPVAVPTCPQSNGTPTCAGVTLMVIPTPGSAEIVDGEPESLLASFFVTDGTTSAPRAVPSAAFPDGDDGALNVVWYPPDTPGGSCRCGSSCTTVAAATRGAVRTCWCSDSARCARRRCATFGPRPMTRCFARLVMLSALVCSLAAAGCQGSDIDGMGDALPIFSADASNGMDCYVSVPGNLTTGDQQVPPDIDSGFNADRWTFSLSDNEAVTLLMCRQTVNSDPKLELFQHGSSVLAATDDDCGGCYGARILYQQNAGFGTVSYDLFAEDNTEPLQSDGLNRNYTITALSGINPQITCCFDPVTNVAAPCAPPPDGPGVTPFASFCSAVTDGPPEGD